VKKLTNCIFLSVQHLNHLLLACGLCLSTQSAIAEDLLLADGHYAGGEVLTLTLDDESAEVVTDCLYSTTDDVGEFGSKGSCGTLDKTGLLHFNQPALDKVDWRNFYGMDCIRVTTNKKASSGWYFLTQEGLGRKTVAADNGCLPFQKGLAVGWVDGKVAYYDRMMKIVHQTDYVWSDDFHTGYAQVCKRKGDRRDYLDCGYIDTDMKVVVETKYPAAETPTPKGNN